MADNTMKFLDLAGLQKLWARIGDVFVRKADLTDDLTKLNGIEEGAQVNVIEGVAVRVGETATQLENVQVKDKDYSVAVLDVETNLSNVTAETTPAHVASAKAVKDYVDGEVSVAKDYADGLVMDGDTPRFDANGAAADALADAKKYTDAEIAKLTSAEDGILADAKAYTDSVVGTLPTTGEGEEARTMTVVEAIDAAKSAAIDDAASKYQVKGDYEVAGAAAQALADAKTYADGLVMDGENPRFDAAGSAATAKSEAIAAAKEYTDGKVDGKFDAAGSAATAEQNAKDYTDGQINEVKALVTASTQFLGVSTTEIKDGEASTVTIDGEEVTPGDGDIVMYSTSEFIWSSGKWVLLGDTTAEMDAIKDLQTAVNTTLPKDIEDAQAAAEAYADGLAKNYDAAGSAAAAETAAKAYADGLAKNYDAAGSAANALDAAKTYTNEKIGTLPNGSTTVADAIANATQNSTDYVDNKIGTDTLVDAPTTAPIKVVTSVINEDNGVKTIAPTYFMFDRIPDAEITALQ